MNKIFVRSITLVGAAGLMLGISAMTHTAQAADCRYDKWGSSQWKGQKYKCPDGSSMYIKPPPISSNSWDSTPENSWERWNGTDNLGNRYNCTWDQWSGRWKCR